MYSDGYHLGKFNVTSGKLRVSDPCYDKGTWCSGTLDVPNGEWDAYLELSDEGSWGTRVASIQIIKDNSHTNSTWELTKIDVGVDSGQAGFFDESFYPEDGGDNAFFYDKVCNLTLGREQGGIIDGFGAVSSTGYGDGGYKCYVARDDAGQIVAAKIIFIDDEYEEDDYE